MKKATIIILPALLCYLLFYHYHSRIRQLSLRMV